MTDGEKTNLFNLLQLLDEGEKFSENWEGLNEARLAGLVENKSLTIKGEQKLARMCKEYGVTYSDYKFDWDLFMYHG